MQRSLAALWHLYFDLNKVASSCLNESLVLLSLICRLNVANST